MDNFRKEILMISDKVVMDVIIPEFGPDISSVDYYRQFLSQFAVVAEQTHSSNVIVIDDCDRSLKDTDAIITFRRGLSVGVLTADCVPILIFAPDINGIGAIHAGWRGTLDGIVERALDVMEGQSADLSRLIVVFGPSISCDNYEVDVSLAVKFAKAGFSDYVHYPSGIDSKPHIDLQGVNMERMLRRGVERGNILLHSGCTFDSEYDNHKYSYHSYRRDGDKAGRQLTMITMPG